MGQIKVASGVSTTTMPDNPIVAILPWVASEIPGVRTLLISSTSLLIVVGVASDTKRQLEAQLMMRNYEGFIG